MTVTMIDTSKVDELWENAPEGTSGETEEIQSILEGLKRGTRAGFQVPMNDKGKPNLRGISRRVSTAISRIKETSPTAGFTIKKNSQAVLVERVK